MATSSTARSIEMSAGFFKLPCPSGALSFNAARQLALFELGIGRPCP
jgi:hypothetical protein